MADSMDTEQVATQLKRNMNYKDGSHVCKLCRYYCRGNALAPECQLNPAFSLSVDPHGYCNHYIPDPSRLSAYREEEKKRNSVPM
jgi:hypothetical protein